MSHLRFAVLLLLGVIVLASGAEAAGHSYVYINGRRSIVHFNDGDSFRIQDGPYANRGSRLAGFNTLESFGPVHAWSSWHPYELYVNAKLATLNAARGVWHCSTDGSVDGYGRLLLDCPDLAVSQIRNGFAHAMNVDDTPSRMEYLSAQQEAIRERRGMWAHGVPSFVLTSLHSRDEDPSRDFHYNRMVSTRDGHSERWTHRDRYPECSWQCATELVADEAQVRWVARSLRSNEATREAVAEVPNLLLIELVDRFARLGTLPEYTTDEISVAVLPVLTAAKAEGRLSDPEERLGACHLYAAFTRRYGRNRASCLHGHGGRPPELGSR